MGKLFRRKIKQKPLIDGPLINPGSGEQGKTFERTLKVIRFHILWMAMRFVDAMTAEDATQNALVDFIEKRRRDPNFIDGQSLTLALLYTVAVRAVAKIWREKKRLNEISTEEADLFLHLMLSARTADCDQATSELLDVIREAVFGMPVVRRKVFLKRHDSAMSFADIAKELGITESAARTHNALALRDLRDALADYEGAEAYLTPAPRGGTPIDSRRHHESD